MITQDELQEAAIDAIFKKDLKKFKSLVELGLDLDKEFKIPGYVDPIHSGGRFLKTAILVEDEKILGFLVNLGVNKIKNRYSFIDRMNLMKKYGITYEQGIVSEEIK